MTLRERQSLLVRCLGQLYVYVYLNGWELTLADGHRPDGRGHKDNSLHYIRLAQDINLFIDGEWIANGLHPVWLEIGQFWESLHPLCRWGGRFGSSGISETSDISSAIDTTDTLVFTGKDSNHFSIEFQGRQ